MTGTASQPVAGNPATGEVLDWTKPGPGTWTLDGSHFKADSSRLAQRAVEVGMKDGIEQGFDLIGSPLRGLQPAFVNGNFYIRMVPLIAGDKDLPPPPSPVIWLMTRIHPTFRRRAKLARKAIDGRIWNDELEQWKTEHRPYLHRSAAALTAMDVGTLDNSGLADHLEETFELVVHGATLHFRLHISDLGPIGLLLVKAREWGLDNVEVMSAMAGSSPATSAPMVALYQIGQIARKARTTQTPFTSLDEVRAVSAKAATLLDEFLAEYGHRLTTGYDLQELTLFELPDMLLNTINITPERSAEEVDADADAAGEAALNGLLAKVPEADHGEFKQLVSDARALYGLRDENGPLTYQWPAGLLRRGLLEAGRRLTQTGQLPSEAHVFDLEIDELVGLLNGGSEPGHAVLNQRMADRRKWATHQAPPVLGLVAEDPPLWTMPGALRELMDVVVTVMDLIETSDQAPTLDGIGIGNDATVGRARVVTDELDALARMEPGDVLIAPFTVPTYNAVLATAGAVVVENGGLLCHAAVIAREYGIPGLVGVAGATKQITDGAMVRVDPVAGTVREVTA
jgi:pyruvate,water dikinase